MPYRRNLYIGLFGISLVCASIFLACSFTPLSENIKKNNSTEIARQFSFSFKVPSSSAANGTGLGKPNSIQFTLQNSSGATLFSQKNLVLELDSKTGSYNPIEILSLDEGRYSLTEFIVRDKNNKIVYASPVKNSDKANGISKILPITFSHDLDTVLEPSVVIAVPGDEKNFGYKEESFNYKEEKPGDSEEPVTGSDFFSITIEFVDEKDSPISNVSLAVSTKQHSEIFKTILEKSSNTVSIPNSREILILSFTKTGYKSTSQEINLESFTNVAGKSTLQITMEEKVSDPPPPEPIEKAIDGFKLYVTNCQSCHGKIGASAKRDATVARIKNGFNKPAMKNLQGKFSQSDLIALEKALAREIDVMIHPGTAENGGHVWSSHGLSGIAPGTTVHFINNDPDGPEHRIHVSIGSLHQDGNLLPGETYTVKFPADANTKFWCHNHESGEHGQSITNSEK